MLLSGCGEKVQNTYTVGMFTDVRDFDFYENAVRVCVENAYMDYEGDSFGVYETMSLKECAEVVSRLAGNKKTENIEEFAVKKGYVSENYGDWSRAATRAEAAYMVSHAMTMDEINEVSDGAISDIYNCEEKDEIYHLYRAGIFSGDDQSNTFRPYENIVRAEMALIVERSVDKSKRVKFTMNKSEVSVIAFGDVLCHEPVMKAAKTEDGYDFSMFFKNIKPYIDAADIACINQETVFVESGFSGYPAFGTPKEVGISEAEAGFDVITQATNHAFDRGEKGILYTTEFWDDYPDINLLGIHENKSDAEKIEVIERNGIKIALLNYTYGLNGFMLPSGKDYLVDLLDDKEKIKSDMEKAKKDSDGILVFLHFGTEYKNVSTDEQEMWAQFFADEGALAVVGAHPHVVEPLEVVTAKDGRKMPVYYSLGNFVSSQNDLQCVLCAMAEFKIVKDSAGIRVEQAKIRPVVTHQEAGLYTAYLLEDYPEEMEARHRFTGKYPGKFSKEKLQEMFDKIVK